MKSEKIENEKLEKMLLEKKLSSFLLVFDDYERRSDYGQVAQNSSSCIHTIFV